MIDNRDRQTTCKQRVTIYRGYLLYDLLIVLYYVAQTLLEPRRNIIDAYP
jgi:hypothetical protein